MIQEPDYAESYSTNRKILYDAIYRRWKVVYEERWMRTRIFRQGRGVAHHVSISKVVVFLRVIVILILTP